MGGMQLIAKMEFAMEFAKTSLNAAHCNSQHEGAHAALACDHSDELDEIIKGAPPVDAQPALHSDRHTPTYGFSHRRTACGHTCRLEHQPCAVAGLHRAVTATVSTSTTTTTPPTPPTTTTMLPHLSP